MMMIPSLSSSTVHATASSLTQRASSIITTAAKNTKRFTTATATVTSTVYQNKQHNTTTIRLFRSSFSTLTTTESSTSLSSSTSEVGGSRYTKQDVMNLLNQVSSVQFSSILYCIVLHRQVLLYYFLVVELLVEVCFGMILVLQLV